MNMNFYKYFLLLVLGFYGSILNAQGTLTFEEFLKKTAEKTNSTSTAAANEAKKTALEIFNIIPSIQATCTDTDYGAFNPKTQAQCQNLSTELVGKMSKAQNTCMKSASIAKFACEAQNYTGIAGFIIGQIKTAQSSGMKQACESAAKLQLGMGALSTGIAGTCLFAKNKCVKSCDQVLEAVENGKTTLAKIPGNAAKTAAEIEGVIDDNLEACGGYEINALNAMASATQLMQGLAQSQQCKNILEDECAKPEAVNNPNCSAAYCSNTQNQQDPRCLAMFGSCSGASAASNPQCACLANPMAEGCNNFPPLTAPNNNSNLGLNDGDENYNFDEDDLGADEGDIPLGDPNAKAPGTVGSFNGGGGGGAGQGNALGGGPGGGSGNRKPGSVYNTDITGGVKDSSSGGSSGGGSGGYASGGGYSSGKYDGGKFGNTKSGLDLKKYLPGGKLAKQRDANDPSKLGVSSANGLSNFEKANRAYNLNRSNLVAP